MQTQKPPRALSFLALIINKSPLNLRQESKTAVVSIYSFNLPKTDGIGSSGRKQEGLGTNDEPFPRQDIRHRVVFHSLFSHRYTHWTVLHLPFLEFPIIT